MFERLGIVLLVWLLTISSSTPSAAQVNSWTSPDEVSDYTKIEKKYENNYTYNTFTIFNKLLLSYGQIRKKMHKAS